MLYRVRFLIQHFLYKESKMKRLLIVGLLLCSGCYNASDRIQWIKENSESTPTIYI